jgi:hypothetical protein
MPNNHNHNHNRLRDENKTLRDQIDILIRHIDALTRAMIPGSDKTSQPPPSQDGDSSSDSDSDNDNVSDNVCGVRGKSAPPRRLIIV